MSAGAHCNAEFIGTTKWDFDDAGQRADAQKIYADIIGKGARFAHSNEDPGRVWGRIRDRWCAAAEAQGRVA